MKEAANLKHEARRAVWEARVMSLRENRSALAAAAAAVARDSDVEAPLLQPERLDSSPFNKPKPPSEAGSQASSVRRGPRDAKALWRSVRRALGLTLRHEEDGAYVERTGVGLRQPAPSWHGLHPAPRSQVVDMFVSLFNGTGLGTGLALRSDSALLSHAPPPGLAAPASDVRAVGHMLTSSYLNILLLCLPWGFWAGAAGKSATAVFTLNFLALIPLALFLGEVTEDLAVRFGDVVGGLLNATFGNVVELLLAISALRLGLYNVVAASLLGSILSNLLLVLGTAFFFGGLKYKEQRFSTLANKVSCSLLFLACIGIMIPSAGRLVYGKHVINHKVIEHLSHVIATVLLGIYIGYLYFQLKTHADCFEEGGGDGSAGDGDSDDGPALSLSGALTCLTTITVVVAICSQLLCGAIEEVADTLNINEAFLGLIVLPIAGNVTEHLTAVFVAVKNKMDLSIGIALGSSIQVAIGIIPVTVLVGWAMGKDFLLDFDAFAVLMLTASVILTYFVCSDGCTNWLLGLQLVATYCLIAFIFCLEKEPPSPPLPPVPSPPPMPRAGW